MCSCRRLSSPSAHLVAAIPQVLQGQPLALSVEETDQCLQQGKKEEVVRRLGCAEHCGIRTHRLQSHLSNLRFLKHPQEGLGNGT